MNITTVLFAVGSGVLDQVLPGWRRQSEPDDSVMSVYSYTCRPRLPADNSIYPACVLYEVVATQLPVQLLTSQAQPNAFRHGTSGHMSNP